MERYLASPFFFEDILAPSVLGLLGFLCVRNRGTHKTSSYVGSGMKEQNTARNFVSGLYRNARDFCIRYPALLSGYMIYGYLFVSTMKFFLDAKKSTLSAFDIFQHFDSLLWMWLLSLALVKIINIRTRLHGQETAQLVRQQELEVRQMQLNTLLQIVRGLQHEVNNPLTIILMTVGKLERRSINAEELRESLKTIRKATERISDTLKAFTSAKQYEVSESPVGHIAKPPEQGPQE
jgi:signal transduction histidine kinase